MMGLMHRKPTVFPAGMPVVNDEAIRWAEDEARTVVEKRVTIPPEMLASWDIGDIVRALCEPFEVVTEARIVEPSKINLNGEDITFGPDDGTRHLILRGVLKD